MLLSTIGFVCYPQACANAARFCAQRAESLDILIAPFRPWMRVARVSHMAAGTAANCTTCARSHLDQLFCCSPNCRSTDERLRNLFLFFRKGAKFAYLVRDSSTRGSLQRLFNTPSDRPRPLVAQGCAISSGSTFAPPAIRGLEGSKCSRISRF